MLADEWRSFREQVVPKDAGTVQVQEMRRAFYCGAKALEFILEGTPDDEAAADKFILDLKAELEEFRNRVASGRD